MTPAISFFISVAIAVVLLGGVLWSGRASRRRLHIALVGLMLVALVVAVVFVERLGASYDIEAAGWITPVHMSLAHGTVIVLLLQVVLGLVTTRRPRLRRWHGRFAIFAVATMVLATVTGLWMLLAAERL
jgi:hypothetical protein